MIKNFIKILIAISILIFIIISRFKRITLTKSFLTFHVLFIINSTIIFCFLLITTLYLLLKNKEKKQNKITHFKNSLQLFFVNLFYIPLQKCDNYINQVLIHYFKFNRINYINKKLHHIYTKILKPNNYSIFNIYFIVYLLLKYIPKFMVSFVFLIDIFYYQQFYYFYWFLPLLLIPLIVQYFKYICFLDYKNFIIKLEESIEIFDIKIGTQQNIIPLINLKEYLNKTVTFTLENKKNPYKGQIGFTYGFYQDLLKKNKLNGQGELNINYEANRKRYLIYLEWVEKVNLIYTLLTIKETHLDLYTNIIIFASYFSGWLYILTFFIHDTSFLNYFMDNYDPFSQLPILL